MDAVYGQLIPALPVCHILALRVLMYLYDDNFLSKILHLWASVFENKNSKTFFCIQIENLIILHVHVYRKKKRSLSHMQKLTIFGPKFDPCWPLFCNQNPKTLLRIYYVTILYRNKMHKLKTEREELTSHVEIVPFRSEIRPLWAPIF